MTTDCLIPGHVLPLCPGCVHHLPDLAYHGHPFACRRVFWLPGSEHQTPTLAIATSGQRCSDFSAAEPTPEPATEATA